MGRQRKRERVWKTKQIIIYALKTDDRPEIQVLFTGRRQNKSQVHLPEHCFRLHDLCVTLRQV